MYWPLALNGFIFATPLGQLSGDLLAYGLWLPVFYLRRGKIQNKELFFVIFSCALALIAVTQFITQAITVTNGVKYALLILCLLLIANTVAYRSGDERYAEGVKAVILIASVVVLADFFLPMPWGWDEVSTFGVSDFYRARGLFPEPSYHCVFVGTLSLVLLLEGEFRSFHPAALLLIFLGLTVTASISGLVILLCLLVAGGFFEFSLKSWALALAIVATVALVFALSDFRFLLERVNHITADFSAVKRVLGSAYGTYWVLINYPLGIGLGSANLASLTGEVGVLYEFMSREELNCLNNKTCSQVLEVGNFTLVSNLTYGFGVLGFCFYIYLALKALTYGVGILVLFLALSMAKSGLYDLPMYLVMLSLIFPVQRGDSR